MVHDLTGVLGYINADVGRLQKYLAGDTPTHEHILAKPDWQSSRAALQDTIEGVTKCCVCGTSLYLEDTHRHE